MAQPPTSLLTWWIFVFSDPGVKYITSSRNGTKFEEDRDGVPSKSCQCFEVGCSKHTKSYANYWVSPFWTWFLKNSVFVFLICQLDGWYKSICLISSNRSELPVHCSTICCSLALSSPAPARLAQSCADCPKVKLFLFTHWCRIYRKTTPKRTSRSLMVVVY